MPSLYQKQSLQALLGLFLEAQGHPLPQHSRSKSASALSRFLNQYTWSTRALLGSGRQAVLFSILAQRQKGRRPTLEVILDLTTIEKTGKFKGLGNLLRVYNGKRGLHLVILYLIVLDCTALVKVLSWVSIVGWCCQSLLTYWLIGHT